MNGVSYELPWLGKFSWENAVAHPNPGLKTVVVGLDDSGGGQVYVYVGEKTSSSDPIEAAGLSNGVLYGIKVEGFPAEDNTSGIPSGTPFTVHNFGDVSYLSGAELEALSSANSVTAFQRPEDGAWDPNNPADFYFVTTASFTGNSRLWRLRFNDPTNPMAGGKIDMLLDGSEGPKMMDNLTVDARGRVFIQEDPGRQDYLAKIWRYSIANDSLELIAEHDPLRFIPGTPNFLTRDEESSGIIPLDGIFGSGWFILVSQAHYATDAELVEGGQLLVLRYPPNR
jgi:secreted PhoX family phosphatase